MSRRTVQVATVRSRSIPNPHAIMQEAIRYYEPIVKKQADTILEVPAIVLANLCVSHIMISQNEEAEELMRKVRSVHG